MLDLVKFKEQTVAEINTNEDEIKQLRVKMEAYAADQKRFNDLLVNNQYLQAIANNLDMLMGFELEVHSDAEDPWAPLIDNK